MIVHKYARSAEANDVIIGVHQSIAIGIRCSGKQVAGGRHAFDIIGYTIVIGIDVEEIGIRIRITGVEVQCQERRNGRCPTIAPDAAVHDAVEIGVGEAGFDHIHDAVAVAVEVVGIRPEIAVFVFIRVIVGPAIYRAQIRARFQQRRSGYKTICQAIAVQIGEAINLSIIVRIRAEGFNNIRDTIVVAVAVEVIRNSVPVEILGAQSYVRTGHTRVVRVYILREAVIICIDIIIDDAIAVRIYPIGFHHIGNAVVITVEIVLVGNTVEVFIAFIIHAVAVGIEPSFPVIGILEIRNAVVIRISAPVEIIIHAVAVIIHIARIGGIVPVRYAVAVRILQRNRVVEFHIVGNAVVVVVDIRARRNNDLYPGRIGTTGPVTEISPVHMR